MADGKKDAQSWRTTAILAGVAILVFLVVMAALLRKGILVRPVEPEKVENSPSPLVGTEIPPLPAEKLPRIVEYTATLGHWPKRGREVALSRDGTRFVSLTEGDNAHVIVQDGLTGQLIKALAPSEEGMNCAAISQDGTLAAAGSENGSLRLWNIDSGEVIAEWKGKRIGAVAIAPDGKQIAASWADQGEQIHVLDALNKTVLHILSGHTGEIRRLIYSADGKMLVSAGIDHTIRVWNLATASEVRNFDGHTQGVTDIALSPDGTRLVSAGSDGRLCLWDMTSGKLIRFHREPDGSNGDAIERSVAFLPDGNRYLSVAATVMQLWDVQTGQMLAEYHSQNGNWPLRAGLLVAPDGKTFIADSAVWPVPEDVQPVAGAVVEQPAGIREVMKFGQVGSDGAFVLDNGAAGFVRAGQGSGPTRLLSWELATGREARRITFARNPAGGQDGGVLALSRDGRFAAVGGSGGNLGIMDAETGKAIHWIPDRMPPAVYRAAFSPDGKWLVTGGAALPPAAGSTSGAEPADLPSAELNVWDVATGVLVKSLKGESDVIWGLAVTPDGKRLLTGGGSRDPIPRALGGGYARCYLYLWNLETGQQIRRMEGHLDIIMSLAMSADGRRAVSVVQLGSPIVWDLETGQAIRTLPSRASLSAAISVDGKRVAIGGSQHDAIVYDVATGAELGRFEGHAGGVVSLQFIADGRIISGGQDGTMRLWALP